MMIEQLADATEIIRARIADAGGRITFAEYMELALYHPQTGYYGAGRVALGRDGDFTTSPEVDPAFGAALAVLARRCDTALGRPDPFLLAEHGAGSGRLLRDLLDALRETDGDLYRRAAPLIVERSAAMRERQRITLDEAGHGAWVHWAEEARGSGLIYSNELLDAFPVHRVIGEANGLREIYVALDGAGRFVEEEGPPSSTALAAYFAAAGIGPPARSSEVNLAAPAWLARVADNLERGYILTIDYGDSAERLYGAGRPEGTLLCYTGGRVTDNPYAAPGEQDMTAHVDFSTLEATGRALGLQTVAQTRQMEFLLDLGLGERIAALSAELPATTAEATTALQTRSRLFRLIDPDGLGRFHVLLQSKGLEEGR